MRWKFAVVVALAAAAGLLIYRITVKDTPIDPQTKRTGNFTVSKETTHATEPLDEAGYIVYVDALNKHLSKGITPDNNATVLLWKASGPRPDNREVPAEFFRLLGIDQPADKGNYFIGIRSFAKDVLFIEPGEQTEAIVDEHARSAMRAWTPMQFPQVVNWLKDNDRALDLVLAASHCSHYYLPVVPTKSKEGQGNLLHSTPIEGLLKSRELIQGLLVRAMLHLGEGRLDAAWEHVLASHRLSRLIGRGAMLVEALVTFATQVAVNAGVEAFLAHPQVTSKQLLKCLRDLQELPPLPSIADKVDLGERYLFLECILMIDRHGLAYLENMSGELPPKEPDWKTNRFLKDIDWDPALRTANQWFDRIVATLRIKDRARRVEQLEVIYRDLQTLKLKSTELANLGQFIDESKPPSEKGQAVGDVLVSRLLPAFNRLQDSGDRCEQIQRNSHIAFALAAYQRDHGRYPKQLSDLTPRYLTVIPNDLFSGKDLIYQPSEQGFILYSVGVNGKDDGGRWAHDEPPGDDLGVRIPLPEPRRKP